MTAGQASVALVIFDRIAAIEKSVCGIRSGDKDQALSHRPAVKGDSFYNALAETINEACRVEAPDEGPVETDGHALLAQNFMRHCFGLDVV